MEKFPRNQTYELCENESRSIIIISLNFLWFLCHLQSIAAHRDHFVWRLSVRLSVRPSVRPSICLCGSHTFLVVTHSYRYALQTTHAFLGMLPLCYVPKILWNLHCHTCGHNEKKIDIYPEREKNMNKYEIKSQTHKKYEKKSIS